MTMINRDPKLEPEGMQELDGLLSSVRLSGARSILARGATLDAVVSLRPCEEHPDCLRALLSVFRTGRGRRRLDGLGLLARSESGGSEVLRLGELTRRGDMALRHLPAESTCRLYIYSAALLRQVWVTLWHAVLATGVRRRRGEHRAAPSSTEPAELVIPFCEGKLQATLRETSRGTVSMAVETRERSLAGRWRLSVVSPDSGAVLYSGEVTMEPVPGEDALWEGRREDAGRVPVVPDEPQFVLEAVEIPFSDAEGRAQ